MLNNPFLPSLAGSNSYEAQARYFAVRAETDGATPGFQADFFCPALAIEIEPLERAEIAADVPGMIHFEAAIADAGSLHLAPGAAPR